MGYAKLYSTITESSLWCEPLPARVLFVSMLAKADATGFVEAALPGLARAANLTIAEVESALEILMAPDPHSKNPANEGRRVAKVPSGWLLLNYGDYRNRGFNQDKWGKNPQVNGYVYYAGDTPHQRVKIGFSKNPWARVNEMRCWCPDAALLVVEKGDVKLEKQRHKQFEALRLSREWFSLAGALAEHIAALRSNDDTRSELRSATEAEAEAEADTKAKARNKYTASFEAWFAIYPRRVGKGDAAAAYGRAIAQISASRGVSRTDAHLWLIGVTQAFARSPAGNAGTFTPHPASWLNKARYDDDPKEWNRERNPDGKPKPGPGQKFDPDKPVSF